MRRHLRQWLNDAVLADLGDAYEGRITDVIEEYIRNRFTTQKVLEPVILFEDGWRLVPNIGQRKALMQFWGSNTEDWRGHRLCVYRLRTERTDPSSGLVKVTWTKHVKLPVPAAVQRFK